MSNQAQIDAIEKLLMAVLKTSGASLSSSTVFAKAQALIMGSDGPSGTTEKTNAANYLAHLKEQLSK
ncbi:hypothetical protein BH711_10880 [Pseudomonas fluorescens]|nr:hypothetical protein BH711_10880 [Pseudomonas fluorescens]